MLLATMDFDKLSPDTFEGKDTVFAFCKNRFKIYREYNGLFRLHDRKKNECVYKIKTWDFKGTTFWAQSEGMVVKISDCDSIEFIPNH